VAVHAGPAQPGPPRSRSRSRSILGPRAEERGGGRRGGLGSVAAFREETTTPRLSPPTGGGETTVTGAVWWCGERKEERGRGGEGRRERGEGDRRGRRRCPHAGGDGRRQSEGWGWRQGSGRRSSHPRRTTQALGLPNFFSSSQPLVGSTYISLLSMHKSLPELPSMRVPPLLINQKAPINLSIIIRFRFYLLATTKPWLLHPHN
jgi:hypothetical protein